MKQVSWKIRKRVLESPGFSINFFGGNPEKYEKVESINTQNDYETMSKK